MGSSIGQKPNFRKLPTIPEGRSSQRNNVRPLVALPEGRFTRSDFERALLEYETLTKMAVAEGFPTLRPLKKELSALFRKAPKDLTPEDRRAYGLEAREIFKNEKIASEAYVVKLQRLIMENNHAIFLNLMRNLPDRS